ncbi:uncharacterized protein LOC125947098 [Dermacentor silvarum]|uniref:uncharacterized protein LOC125947098 n=1 Tax=Dermacentor silvarum TaxID=543639 RepID=UPI0021013817|nr:uncharacterized protein LOC125947098 [Dermacentor silvarum]
MDDQRDWNPWRRRPQPLPYYQVPADRRVAGEAMWREYPAYPQLGRQQLRDGGMAGVPGRGQYYEVPRPAPREPYAVREKPPPMAHRGANVAPTYQAPLRPSAILPHRAEPAPRQLPYAHKQAPAATCPSIQTSSSFGVMAIPSPAAVRRRSASRGGSAVYANFSRSTPTSDESGVYACAKACSCDGCSRTPQAGRN